MNEVYHQMTLDEWDKILEETKWHLNNIASSFIIVGYNLKQMRDEEVWRLKGYGSMSEFTEKELCMSKSAVTRAIQMNEKYANGKIIKPQYLGYGRNLLEAMLGLTDEQEKLILPETTREDVRDLKRFEKNEPEERIGIEEALIRFFSEYPEDYEELLEEEDLEERVDIINPSGSRTYKNGDVYLWFYDINTGVKYRIFGKTETVELSWEEFFGHMESLQERIQEEIRKKKVIHKKEEPKVESEKQRETKQISQKSAVKEIEKQVKNEEKQPEPPKLEIPEPEIGKIEPQKDQNPEEEEPASLNEIGEKVVPAQLEKELEKTDTMTVFEKLKKKTLPELAKWLSVVGCPPGSSCNGECDKEKCENCWELYLNQYEVAE